MAVNYKSIAKNLKFEGRAFINGKYVNAIDGKKFETINPATGEKLCTVAKCNKNDVDMGNVSVPHFGVHLSRKDFDALKQRLKENGTKYYDEPYLRFKGTKYEQETFFVKDPNENVLEIKTLTANPE